MTETVTLEELARLGGAELRGNRSKRISGVNTLSAAKPGELSFLANSRYRTQLRETRAGAVVLSEDMADECPGDVLIADNPYAAFARMAAAFDRHPVPESGIHESAVVDPAARVDGGASIGPHAVIEAGAVVAAGCVVGPGCLVGRDSILGEACRLTARVTVLHGVRLGKRVLVHPGAVIGSDGFGLAMDSGQWVKVPQLGGVIIGDDCEIGANTTIDRGTLQDTVLEEDVRLDNQIQIAHNVRIGAHTAMAGCSAVAGSATIGRHCMIGGGAGILGHLVIADHVVITAMSLVTRSISEPGEYSSGSPLQENRRWRRNAARMRQLDDMARRLRALERGGPNTDKNRKKP